MQYSRNIYANRRDRWDWDVARQVIRLTWNRLRTDFQGRDIALRGIQTGRRIARTARPG
jgi:hypothetical protein